jgi:hypothetical protein
MAELAGAIIDLVLSVLTARAMSWRPFDGVRARRRTTEFARGQQVAVPFRWEDVPLLLGLGGVALLVGGIGVANTMVISVLERRSEIGLRRALGATRRQIHAQFVTESLILSALGGLGGVTLGCAGHDRVCRPPGLAVGPATLGGLGRRGTHGAHRSDRRPLPRIPGKSNVADGSTQRLLMTQGRRRSVDDLAPQASDTPTSSRPAGRDARGG